MSKEDLGLLLERGIVNPTNQEEYIEYMDFKSQCRQDGVLHTIDLRRELCQGL